MSVYGVNGDGSKDVSNSILMKTANLFVIYFSRFSITSARDSLLNVVSGNYLQATHCWKMCPVFHRNMLQNNFSGDDFTALYAF
jgi:hypothetical protein